MPKILISYRRSDTAGVAGRIYDRLVGRYGRDSIFMDVDHIPFGTDFRAHIRETLLAGDMLIAIVGPHWLGPRSEGRARIHDENDPVRVEIETALGQHLAVIPVLVDGAVMPTPEQLPEALSDFSYLNAAPVDTGRDFHQHTDRLLRSIDGILEKRAAASKPPPPLTYAETALPRPAAISAPASDVPAASLRAKWFVAGGIAAAAAALMIFLGPQIGSLFQPGNVTTPSRSSKPASGPPIKIGMGIVQSGPAAPLGKEALLAAKIWQEDVNAHGGLVGRPVELIARDDEGAPSNVAGIYSRLIDNDKADLLVSGWPAFLISAALPIVTAKNKLFLGLLGNGANDDLNYARYFSMAPTGPSGMPVYTRGIFDIAMTQNPKPRWVAISGTDEPACSGARVQAKQAGLPVVHDESYAFETTDFAPIARAIAAGSPDLVIACSFSGDAAAFVRAFGETGFKPKMIAAVMPGLRTAAIKAELGPLLNGWINFDYWLPVPKMQFAGVTDLIQKYQLRARDEGADLVGHQLAPWSFARMQVLQQAVEATKGLDDTRLADFIRASTFKTVVGDVKFGDKGEWAQPRILQVQFQNIKGNDIGQFRDVANQVVVDPPAFKSGNLIYPFADARK